MYSKSKWIDLQRYSAGIVTVKIRVKSKRGEWFIPTLHTTPPPGTKPQVTVWAPQGHISQRHTFPKVPTVQRLCNPFKAPKRKDELP